MFEVKPTPLAGCVEIKPRIFKDERGKFVKLFHSGLFAEHSLMDSFEEEYYSVSSKGVLRGLHFQEPPEAHIKLVTCITGKILDVVVDLRKASATFKHVHATVIDSEEGNMLYVPEGFAHGFYTLSDKAVFLSMNSKKFSPEHDKGIHWDSIGFNWPDKSPIVSEKDAKMIFLNDYQSPF